MRMGGKVVSEAVELGRDGLRVGMGTDVRKGWVVSHGSPDVQDPTI